MGCILTVRFKEAIMPNEGRKEFYNLADEFVRLANQLSAKWPPSRISAAMLYAAARYNVFNFLNPDTPPGETRESAVEYLRKQYEEMLLENFDTLSRDKS
jgi:hypothetical protein